MIFEASINLIIIAPIEIGAINGNVTYINFLIGLAPSIAAARNGSFGSDKRPANKSKNINGVHCQTSTMITVIFAKDGSVSHLGDIPKFDKMSFTGPKDSWKKVLQITVMITGVVIIGIRNNTLKNL